VLACTALGVLPVKTGYGQESERHKVPVIDKINAGNSHQAFNGTVQSFNEKEKVLNVNTVEGGNTEIFPLKKSVRVETVAGARLDLTALAPGTNVMIFFDQRNGQRKVTRIEVLGMAPPAKNDKKPSPPS